MRRWTIAILIAVAALLIAWDVWIYVQPPGGDTISEIVHGWARKYTSVPFAFGVLMGHFFFPLYVRNG